jgi:hypothetical protein
MKAGPKFMENRTPFNLTQIIRIYNIYQITGCLFFIVKSFQTGFSFKHTWKCFDEPKFVGYLDENLVITYSYQSQFLLLRLSEFLETIFFILRKKFNQVSILHVYHHISVPFLFWLFLKYSGGRMEIFIVVINSYVHVLMYGYYFLSSFQKYQKYTRLIKPCITAIQIIQLFIIFIHSVIALLPGCHATWLFILQAINVGFLIVMFLKFYLKNFSKSEKKIN